MRYNALLDTNEVAAALAHADDNAQSKFFSVFIKELLQYCETRHSAEMQLCFVSNHLTENEKEMIRCLCMEDSK